MGLPSASLPPLLLPAKGEICEKFAGESEAAGRVIKAQLICIIQFLIQVIYIGILITLLRARALPPNDIDYGEQVCHETSRLLYATTATTTTAQIWLEEVCKLAAGCSFGRRATFELAKATRARPRLSWSSLGGQSFREAILADKGRLFMQLCIESDLNSNIKSECFLFASAFSTLLFPRNLPKATSRPLERAPFCDRVKSRLS